MRPTFLALLACAACQTAPALVPSAPEPPQAVVAIVIDQFASWQADERLERLRPGNGLGRFLRDGQWHHAMTYEHGATDTALGHASLFSGRWPGELGVDRNETCEGHTHRSAFVDDATHLIGFGGPLAPDRHGVSLAPLGVAPMALVADALRKAPSFGEAGGIIGVSLKDRASLFACGHASDFCAYFDRTTGGFVTTDRWLSRPIAPVLWDAVARDPAAPRPNLRASQPLPLDLRGAPSDFDDEQAIAPPLRKHDPAFLMFRARPEADDAIAQLGLVAAKHWHRTHPRAPLFLALSFSAHDYVGHSYGARSPASELTLQQIDASLARLFRWLDEAYPGRWRAVLSSDHGVRSRDLPRLRPETLVDELRTSHPSDLPEAPIDCLADPYLRWKPGTSRELRGRYVAHWRAHLPSHLGGIVDAEADCPGDGEVALVCRGLVPGRSLARDSFVYAAPDAMLDPEGLEGQGSNHGSPHVEDRTVPLLVMDAGRHAPSETRAPVRFDRFRRALLERFEEAATPRR